MRKHYIGFYLCGHVNSVMHGIGGRGRKIGGNNNCFHGGICFGLKIIFKPPHTADVGQHPN
jgi:hypothetical protein